MKQQPEEIKEEKVIVVEKEPAEVMKPEPVQEPKTANVESTTATAEPAASAGNDSDEGLFRLNTPKFESKIKVTGKIDLNALNQSTRPKKKTKEERKKEREDKREKFAGNSRVTGFSIKDRKTERQDQVLLSNREKAVRMQRKNVTVSRKTA